MGKNMWKCFLKTKKTDSFQFMRRKIIITMMCLHMMMIMVFISMVIMMKCCKIIDVF